MTQKRIIIRPVGSSSYPRRQHLLHESPSSSTSSRLAEVAGGTTADCVAVWCCCPCTVVNLVVLVVYKVPAGICKKALKMRRKRRMQKKGILPLPSFPNSSSQGKCRCSDLVGFEPETKEITVVVMDRSCSDSDIIMDKDFLQLEENMWDRFYATGFWRSPSQRE